MRERNRLERSISAYRALENELTDSVGLIEMADGTVVPVAAPSSPLALNMRMKMIGPETITPVTNILRALYWPPVMITILIAAAIAEGWLYFGHGVSAGLRDVIYSPRLMLIVLLMPPNVARNVLHSR